MKRISRAALIALVVVGGGVLIFRAFSGNAPATIPSDEMAVVEQEKKLSVVASFYPLAYLAQAIGGQYVDVTNLAGSRDVHAYTPSPREVERIRSAEVVFYHSEYLEAWMADATSTVSSDTARVVEVMSELDETLIREGSGGKDTHDTEEHEHEHEEEGEHAHNEEEDGEHDHGGIDPHTWGDPILYGEMADIVKEALIAADSEYANVFESNYAALEEQLEGLDKRFMNRLSSCERDEVIVSHDAFGYLADRYGFQVLSIAGISTLDEPSAQLLAELRTKASEGMTHILAEEGSVTAYAETLSRETGLELLTINPLGRGPLDEGKDYFDVMGENLEVLARALGCEQKSL